MISVKSKYERPAFDEVELVLGNSCPALCASSLTAGNEDFENVEDFQW